jgi:PIN domain nuclease of toxin-antitoxin system
LNLLLDTSVLVRLVPGPSRALKSAIRRVLASPGHSFFASAGSVWEIAIKTRLGKLDPALPLERLADFYVSLGMSLLAIDHRHAIVDVNPEPGTRDPFDRLLLAQCAVENMRLVTTDAVLESHPLVWQA